MPARASLRSVAARSQNAGRGGTEMERTLSIDGEHVDEPIATHDVRGGGGLRLHVREWGDPQGPPIVFVHGWSQSQLCWSRQIAGPLAERLQARHLRPPRPRHVRAAAGRRAVRRRAALGRRPQRGDRAARARPADAGRVVLRRVRRDRLPRRLRRSGDRRRRPGGRRGAAHTRLRAHRAGPARERGRRVRTRPAGEHRGRPPVPARVHGPAAQRPRLGHGAVLEHGRPARGERRAVRAARSTTTTCSPACPSRCW